MFEAHDLPLPGCINEGLVDAAIGSNMMVYIQGAGCLFPCCLFFLIISRAAGCTYWRPEADRGVLGSCVW